MTSPWYSPELQTNIALAYVPVSLSAIGTELKVWLPATYSDAPGQPADAQVVEVPFRPSVSPSARETAKADGRDYAH